MGYQLDLVQRGRNPDDWKPLHGIGPGVREIRIRDKEGAFRAVYVLHCFQKKTEKTSRRDLDLIAHRYKELSHEQ